MGRNDLRRVRTFVAIELGTGVKHLAQELIKKLKLTGADVNWIAPEHMHLTLKFLGEIQRDDILPLCQITQQVASGFAPFDLGFGGTGAFPHTEHPRTLWIGVEEGLEEFTVQAELDDALHKELGFARERRQFTPHLTIGRVHRATPEMNDVMEQNSAFEGDFSEVDELVVMASFLDRDVPQYETLGHAVLGADDADDEFDNDEFDDE